MITLIHAIMNTPAQAPIPTSDLILMVSAFSIQPKNAYLLLIYTQRYVTECISSKETIETAAIHGLSGEQGYFRRC
jgi:hypothetical protein